MGRGMAEVLTDSQLSLALQPAVARDDSVHLVTTRNFRRFVKVATDGDVRAFQMETPLFYTIACIDALLSGDERKAATLIDTVIETWKDREAFEKHCARLSDERMVELEKAGVV